MAGKIAPGFWYVDAAFVLSETSKKLADALNVSIQEAATYRSLLYGWAVKVYIKADGNISDFRNKAIEDACTWSGERNKLCTAFHAAGVLSGDPDDDDNPLVICDWASLAADILKGRKDNADRQDKYRNKNKAGIAPHADVTRYVTEGVTPPIKKKNNKNHNHSNSHKKEKEAEAKPTIYDDENFKDAAVAGYSLWKDLQDTLNYAHKHIRFITPNDTTSINNFVLTYKLPCELIRYAIDKACAAGKYDRWDYCNTILLDWLNGGIFTLEAAKERDNTHFTKARQAQSEPLKPKYRILE